VLNATKNTIENMGTIQYTSEEEPKRGARIGLVLFPSLKNFSVFEFSTFTIIPLA
jgi:hypothetical protein